MRFKAPDGKDICVRTTAFAVRVTNLYAALPKTFQCQAIGQQLFRSGTSVGAHVAEASFAKSRADFISKLDGALQELAETKFWFKLLSDGGFVPVSRLTEITAEAGEITAIISTIVGRSRRNSKS